MRRRGSSASSQRVPGGLAGLSVFFISPAGCCKVREPGALQVGREDNNVVKQMYSQRVTNVRGVPKLKMFGQCRLPPDR